MKCIHFLCTKAFQKIIQELSTFHQKKQYIALTEDERKFFLADKDHYDTWQKTIILYYRIATSWYGKWSL